MTESDELCKNVPLEMAITVSEHDGATSLSELKSNKATGHDNFYSTSVKGCAAQLKSLFAKLFKYVINLTTVPKAWKCSIIGPVPKETKCYCT